MAAVVVQNQLHRLKLSSLAGIAMPLQEAHKHHTPAQNIVAH